MKLIFFLVYPVILMSCEMISCQNDEQSTSQEKTMQNTISVSSQPVQQEQKAPKETISQQGDKVKINTVQSKEFHFKNIKINADDPLEDAGNVYEENKNAPDGVYINDGLVLVVVCVPLEDETSLIEPEGRAMLAEIKLLRKNFNLPEKIAITRENLENGENDDATFYRLVTAYRLADIENAVKKASEENTETDKVAPPTVEDGKTDKVTPSTVEDGKTDKVTHPTMEDSKTDKVTHPTVEDGKNASVLIKTNNKDSDVEEKESSQKEETTKEISK